MDDVLDQVEFPRLNLAALPPQHELVILRILAMRQLDIQPEHQVMKEAPQPKNMLAMEQEGDLMIEDQDKTNMGSKRHDQFISLSVKDQVQITMVKQQEIVGPKATQILLANRL